MDQRYNTGQEIHVGGRVAYNNQNGRIVLVADRGECEKDYESNEHATGFMIEFDNGARLRLVQPASAVRPKRADRINGDLAAANVYSKLDQKTVTMWLDLRNKAAHGHYTEYSKEQVRTMISGITEFMVRLPA